MGLKRELVRAKVAEIEAEMRNLGWWDVPPPPAEAFESRVAFFGDTMTFGQWLRFVLIPRVHQIVEQNGEFPATSSVGVKAIRELDGFRDTDRLVSLLIEFDDIFRADDEASMVESSTG